MRVKINGHAIKDADISHISLVKRGANQVPFTIVKNEVKKSDYAAPATSGEVAADTPQKSDERNRIHTQRVLEREITELGDAFRIIETTPGLNAAARQHQLHSLAVEINAKRQQLHSLRDPHIAKSIDQFDLMMLGVSPAHHARGGQSFTVDATIAERLSKQDRQFADDLRAEALGVRRSTATVKKTDDQRNDFADYLGVRRKS